MENLPIGIQDFTKLIKREKILGEMPKQGQGDSACGDNI